MAGRRKTAKKKAKKKAGTGTGRKKKTGTRTATRTRTRTGEAAAAAKKRGGGGSWEALYRLLGARNEHPERLAQIDREIWGTFGATRAAWVLDMCGFSRLTVRHGITHFLAMIHRLHTLVRPIVAAAGGQVVKTEADNVFAVFDDVPAAVSAAREVQARLHAANAFLPEDWDLHASIGIGHGDVLLVGDHDFYGSEINIASKLGEDVAGPGEIYLSEAAYRRVADGAAAPPVERCEILISAMTVIAYRLTE